MTRMEFDAVVQSTSRGGGGALVPLPENAAEVFGTRARFPIHATFNGIPYRGSTMPMGDGTFCVGITKAIRADSGADIGDTVHVVLERDNAERVVDVPPDLAEALQEAGLMSRFGAMAFTHRKEYARWVAEAKRAETRAARVAKAVTMIGDGARLS
jgi:Domain of unknown function (DUF1905)/Bacteriocin-protection, YdeI or OmpD-Associated